MARAMNAILNQTRGFRLPGRPRTTHSSAGKHITNGHIHSIIQATVSTITLTMATILSQVIMTRWRISRLSPSTRPTLVFPLCHRLPRFTTATTTPTIRPRSSTSPRQWCTRVAFLTGLRCHWTNSSTTQRGLLIRDWEVLARC